jgi:hypothetical protein
LTKSSDGLGNNPTSLRVTNRRLDLDKTREKFWNEGTDSDSGIDELCHVVSDTTSYVNMKA